jgi:hypothetical protein
MKAEGPPEPVPPTSNFSPAVVLHDGGSHQIDHSPPVLGRLTVLPLTKGSS